MYSDSEDEEKSAKANNDSDSDLNPPRKGNASQSTKASKVERNKVQSQRKEKKENSDSDLSPPRSSSKRHNEIKRDLDPPRRGAENKSERKVSRKSRWDTNASEQSNEQTSGRQRTQGKTFPESRALYQRLSDSDESPPRKTHKKSRRDSSSDTSLQRRKNEAPKKSKSKKYNRNRASGNHRNGSDSDLSPPRKDKSKHIENPYKSSSMMKERKREKRKNDSDSDQSPPRRSRTDRKPDGKDRKRYKHKSSSDSDLSPPRKDKTKRIHSPTSNRNTSNNDRKREKYNNASDSGSPRRTNISDSPPPSNKKMAKTLEGKLAGLQNAVQLREENEAYRRREAEAYGRMTDDVSGRNAQVVSRKKKRETSEERKKQHEKQERQKILDEKYSKWSRGLKQIEAHEERIQDFKHEAAKPLARYKDDRDLEDKLKDVERDGDPMLKYIRERKIERGELGPQKPMYKGDFPPNRFNLRPGYRWDGFDRSNGYEKKYFENQSKKRAQAEEAYKWSTEDL
ncbi:unnamed protein product [Leptidea sinapis]|nr:unnamed protein product [Leptidea sinapis]